MCLIKVNAHIKGYSSQQTQKVHLGQKMYFLSLFLDYISHCSALTHMFLQACNMLHRATSSLPALWLDDQIISDRPRLFMQLCECALSPSDWDVHTAQKSRDTQEPLQYDRLPLFVQAVEGLHMQSVCLRMLSC